MQMGSLPTAALGKAKSTGVGSHSLFQEIFLTQGSNLHLLHLLLGGGFFTTGASLVAQLVKNLPAMWKTQFDPWVGKIHWRRKWQPTPVFLLGESRGQSSLVGYSPGGCKELYMTEQLHSLH